MTLLRLLRRTARKLPAGVRMRLLSALRRSSWGVRLTDRAFQDSADVFILSFPKTGRTWLRFMLGYLLTAHFKIDAGYDDLMLLGPLSRKIHGIPSICVTHDGDPHEKSPGELETDKTSYRGKKVVLLTRDIRDTLVSLYFQNVKRMPEKKSSHHRLVDLDTFVRARVGSLETIIRYYNIWAENRHVPDGFLLVRYEDMHTNTERELRKVVDFLGLDAIEDDLIARTVEFARFENMRRMEHQGQFTSFRMQPGTQRDWESYKTRRGEVGGYTDYMNEELIDYVTDRIESTLSDFYKLT